MRALMTSVALSLAVLVTQSPLRAEEKNKPEVDLNFLDKAFSCSVAEVKLSEYAAKHANDEKVRDFADQLVKDHKALNTRLAENAKRLKRAVVAGQEKETKEKYDRLAKLKGNEYDVEYLQCLIEGHEKAIKLFEQESKNGSDSDLKTMATNNLSIIKKHLEDARSHLARVKK